MEALKGTSTSTGQNHELWAEHLKKHISNILILRCLGMVNTGMETIRLDPLLVSWEHQLGVEDTHRSKVGNTGTMADMQQSQHWSVDHPCPHAKLSMWRFLVNIFMLLNHIIINQSIVTSVLLISPEWYWTSPFHTSWIVHKGLPNCLALNTGYNLWWDIQARPLSIKVLVLADMLLLRECGRGEERWF